MFHEIDVDRGSSEQQAAKNCKKLQNGEHKALLSQDFFFPLPTSRESE
jgi:hypothetical protein